CASDLEGPRPAVLLVHEWWGRGDHMTRRATMLAELGYAAFALDMYGQGKLTDDPAQARTWATAFYTDRALARDRAAAGLATLRDQPSVDPSRVAVMGYCFGGTMAFELAYSGAGVDGAVSFHGNPLAPQDGDDADTRLLVLHGGDDPLVPMDAIASLLSALTQAGVDTQVHVFSGAQHSFTSVEADGHGIDGVRYDATADERSWRLMQLFFDELWGSTHATTTIESVDG
ncbi:MAG: dienelactone hydrolase family protein, partial [Planctomycetota bacterium]